VRPHKQQHAGVNEANVSVLLAAAFAKPKDAQDDQPDMEHSSSSITYFKSITNRVMPKKKSHDLETLIRMLLNQSHAFSEVSRSVNGQLFVVGNRCLQSLNLSRNQIGGRGLRALSDMIEVRHFG
jgi:hypothetical protein